MPLLKDPSREEHQEFKKIPLARLGILSVSVLAICQSGVVNNLSLAIGLWIVGVSLLILFLKQDAGSENRIFPQGTLNPFTTSGSGLVMLSAFFMATISLTVYGPFLMHILFGAEP